VTPKYPLATEIHYLKGVLPLFQEMLDYCAWEALQQGDGLKYDPATDEVVYFLHVTDDDRQLFPWLRPVEDIYIIQRGGTSN
jgi:hypothetical protein